MTPPIQSLPTAETWGCSAHRKKNPLWVLGPCTQEPYPWGGVGVPACNHRIHKGLLPDHWGHPFTPLPLAFGKQGKVIMHKQSETLSSGADLFALRFGRITWWGGLSESGTLDIGRWHRYNTFISLLKRTSAKVFMVFIHNTSRTC